MTWLTEFPVVSSSTRPFLPMNCTRCLRSPVGANRGAVPFTRAAPYGNLLEGHLRCVDGGLVVPRQLKNNVGPGIGIALSFDRAQLYVAPSRRSGRHAGHLLSLALLCSLRTWPSPRPVVTGEKEIMFWKKPRGPELLRSHTDESLCREVAKGNHEAFLVLFDRYWQDVFRLARAVLRNEAEAEDLVQALFLEVHTTMLRFDEEKGFFRTRILRYAYTRAIDHRRRLESRQYYANLDIDDVEPEALALDGSLASGLSPEERTRLIQQGLEALEDKQRTAVTAYFFRGLSMEEIAKELGESYGNARHYLYRGLERMRKTLARKEETEESSEKTEQRAALRLESRATKRVAPEVSGV
jgi:RNA polymerase sigma-70 factor, ECF subfamily